MWGKLSFNIKKIHKTFHDIWAQGIASLSHVQTPCDTTAADEQLWQKEKYLLIINFSVCHNVANPIQ